MLFLALFKGHQWMWTLVSAQGSLEGEVSGGDGRIEVRLRRFVMWWQIT
jgi:hypothetical protein